MSIRDKQKREQELDEEIGSHLRMAERDLIERGETPDEAHYAARREMGNESLIKEVTRSMWGTDWIGTLAQDLRYGVAYVVAKSRVQPDSNFYAGAGHQRHYGDLQRCLRRAAAPASV